MSAFVSEDSRTKKSWELAELAAYKKEEIQNCRETFEAALASQTFIDFIQNAIEDVDYYEGRQWTTEDLVKLPKGIKPSTTNLIAPRIDAVSGKEVRSRTRFIYESRSGKEGEVVQAGAISALALQVQEKNRTSRLLSEAKHHSRITGLGFHGFDVVDGRIIERTENVFDVVWDTRDNTPLMSNQGFSARVKWMTLEEAQRRFPQRAEDLKNATTQGWCRFSTPVAAPQSTWRLYAYNGYWSDKDKLIGIIEFQYRVPETFYRATTESGMVVDTFDKEEAEKLAANKKAIVENDGYKVCFAYFCGQVDLDWFESPYQLDPCKGSFLITPVVFARGLLDGVPYGLVRKAKDSQRLYNIKQSKLNWMMAARGVRYQKGAFDKPKEVAAQINNPSYFIEVNPGKEVVIEEHGHEIAQHYQALALHRQEIEAALGIFDEYLGKETNATSGVAIKQRQNAADATQIFADDGFNEAQRDVAEKMLGLIRSVFTDEMAVDITDDEEAVKTLRLNAEEDGKRVMDVRMGQYDVVVETVPDADTMNDIAREYILELVRAGVRLEQLTSGWLDLMNVPKSASLRKEIENGVQQKLRERDQLLAEREKIGNGMGPVPMRGASAPVQLQ